MPTFDIVVSCENNAYLVWQAMLFHYSCRHVHGRAPVVVVHKGDEPLLPGFERIAAAGGIVQTAPNYRRHGGVHYAPRNTAATLRHVQSDADYLVLCDPDMIFLQPLPLEAVDLDRRRVSFDALSYLVPDAPENQPALDDVCRRAGIAPSRLRDAPVNGGVPHVIPAGLKQSLSDAWLDIIELFPTIPQGTAAVGGTSLSEGHTGPQKHWLATMWAVVLAVHRLGLEPVMTRWCIDNFRGGEPLPTLGPAGPRMIHYCYGDAGFDKRRFNTLTAADSEVWRLAPGDATISGMIRQQLAAARSFYGVPAVAKKCGEMARN